MSSACFGVCRSPGMNNCVVFLILCHGMHLTTPEGTRTQIHELNFLCLNHFQAPTPLFFLPQTLFRASSLRNMAVL